MSRVGPNCEGVGIEDSRRKRLGEGNMINAVGLREYCNQNVSRLIEYNVIFLESCSYIKSAHLIYNLLLLNGGSGEISQSTQGRNCLDVTKASIDIVVSDTFFFQCLVCFLSQVSRLAGVLVKNGVRKGDLVVIYMPMVPQAMFTMLACARIGAPHSLIFGGFASRELSVRIDHAKVRKT